MRVIHSSLVVRPCVSSPGGVLLRVWPVMMNHCFHLLAIEEAAPLFCINCFGRIPAFLTFMDPEAVRCLVCNSLPTREPVPPTALRSSVHLHRQPCCQFGAWGGGV